MARSPTVSEWVSIMAILHSSVNGKINAIKHYRQICDADVLTAKTEIEAMEVAGLIKPPASAEMVTLRDQFAGQAMQALVSYNSREYFAEIAWHAYKAADAMLTERARSSVR